MLGVSPSTVRRWADTGRLSARRAVSGQRRFRLAELEALCRDAAGRPPSGTTQPGSHLDQRYQILYETGLDLTSSLELGEVLEAAARRLTEVLRIRDCDIYRLDGDGRLVCLASMCAGVRDKAWVGHALRLEEWPVKRLAVETGRTVTVTALDDRRLSAIERQSMLAYEQRSSLGLPLLLRGRVIGLVALLDPTPRHFTEEEVATAEATGRQLAQALEHATLYDEVKRLHLGNLRALSSALSAKDYYTLGHASRVAAYVTMLGVELGWSQERLRDVEGVAFCHDIGKIGVSDRVLLKAGPLTSEEWELMRQHPGISAEIVGPLFDSELVAGVRHHHERFDGSGYPDHLAGMDIPLVARAMCVVDCYDAMSCRRPYRRALSYRQCVAELRRCAGSQFDPQMVEAFLGALRDLKRRRGQLAALARQAAQLIDPAKHARLRSRVDEQRPEYREMVKALRTFRDAHRPIRYVTTFAMNGAGCISVLDASEVESDISHCGDPWLAEDEMARLLVGENLAVNTLTADDFGVWVSGIAPICDAQGAVVAVISLDEPAVEGLGQTTQDARSHALETMLRSAAVRYSRAEVEAITDGLTGLYNHRYLHERLEEELERARRAQDELSVLFCDGDRFKVYNDTYGHKAGDEALGIIARQLELCGRRIDLVARYGGDEFVLVLLGTGRSDARRVAERIGKVVRESSSQRDRPLSVSIGIATFPDDASSKDELLDKADWAMYAAKRAGRDRVLAFSDEMARPNPDLTASLETQEHARR